MASTLIITIIVALVAIRLVFSIIYLAGAAIKIGLILLVLVAIFGTAGLAHQLGVLNDVQKRVRATLDQSVVTINNGGGTVTSRRLSDIARQVQDETKLPNDSVHVYATCQNGVQILTATWQAPGPPLGLGHLHTYSLQLPDNGQCKAIHTVQKEVKKRLTQANL